MIELNRADSRVLEALSRMKEPGNQAVLNVISSEMEDAKQKLVRAGDMAMIHRLQGRAEALEDLLRAVDDASSVVRRK